MYIDGILLRFLCTLGNIRHLFFKFNKLFQKYFFLYSEFQFFKCYQGRKQYDQVKNDELYDDNTEQCDFYDENRYLPIFNTNDQVYDHIYDQPYSQVDNESLQKVSSELDYLEMNQKK